MYERGGNSTDVYERGGEFNGRVREGGFKVSGPPFCQQITLLSIFKGWNPCFRNPEHASEFCHDFVVDHPHYVGFVTYIEMNLHCLKVYILFYLLLESILSTSGLQLTNRT